MSILLDAVTRAKQQESDILLDPVLTPRAQYDDFSDSRQRPIIFAFGGLILLLLLIIAWLVGRTYLMTPSSELPVAALTATQPAVQAPEPNAKPVMPQEFNTNEQGIRLAGKVALPLAAERPVATQKASYTDNGSRAAMSGTDQSVNDKGSASTPSSENMGSASEPIMLGANTNQKGQDMLASLKLQVNAAASDVGLDNSETTAKNYQSENNLLAAFEAALKEVEIKNSVTRPVTATKLDPIPTPVADEIPKYGQLPAGIQLQVPEFNINAHVYSSNPNNRWLNVDGAELQEGDKIGGKLEIIEIRPRDVVLAVQGTQFKVPAI